MPVHSAVSEHVIGPYRLVVRHVPDGGIVHGTEHYVAGSQAFIWLVAQCCVDVDASE